MIKQKKIIKSILGYTIAFLAITVAASLLRFWVFDIFLIPSKSMEPTLIPGDRILVLKPNIGARIYNDFSSIRTGKPDVRRTKGLRHIQHNDIIVFNYPGYDDRIFFNFNNVYAKRCIAVPGDTLYVEDGYFRIPEVNVELGYLPGQNQLLNTPDELMPEGMLYDSIRSQNSVFNWTVKNLGPLYIPKKYSTIQLTSYNLPIYSPAIEYETGLKPYIVEGNIIHDGKCINRYTFLTNYYFACGDNIVSSFDSRYWGFIPEEFIMGVTNVVLLNFDKNKRGFKFSRIFKVM